ncbi:MAG: DUF4352 domain-containing protein [Actinomycetota bacterium]
MADPDKPDLENGSAAKGGAEKDATVRLSTETRSLKSDESQRTASNGLASGGAPKRGHRAPKGGKRKVPPLVVGKRRVPPLVLALLVLLGVVLIVFASRGEEKAAPGAKSSQEQKDSKSKEDKDDAAKIGEPAELAKLQGTVIRVNRNAQASKPEQAPPPGQKYFAVEFRLTNRDDRPVTIVAVNQFKLKDAADRKYGISDTGVPDPRFPDGVVAPGQTVQGWIAFQIPSDASKLRLQFNAKVPRA